MRTLEGSSWDWSTQGSSLIPPWLDLSSRETNYKFAMFKQMRPFRLFCHSRMKDEGGKIHLHITLNFPIKITHPESFNQSRVTWKGESTLSCKFQPIGCIIKNHIVSNVFLFWNELRFGRQSECWGGSWPTGWRLGIALTGNYPRGLALGRWRVTKSNPSRPLLEKSWWPEGYHVWKEILPCCECHRDSSCSQTWEVERGFQRMVKV